MQERHQESSTAAERRRRLNELYTRLGEAAARAEGFTINDPSHTHEIGLMYYRVLKKGRPHADWKALLDDLSSPEMGEVITWAKLVVQLQVERPSMATYGYQHPGLPTKEELGEPLETEKFFLERLAWLEEQNPHLLKELLKDEQKLLAHLRRITLAAALAELNLTQGGMMPSLAREEVLRKIVAPPEPAQPEEEVLDDQDRSKIRDFEERVENGEVEKTYQPPLEEVNPNEG